MLKRIKEEPDDDCEPSAKRETEHNPDEQQLQQPQDIPQHDRSPPVKARTRKAPYSKGGIFMSYRTLLGISKSYGKLAAAKKYAERKLWGGLSSLVGPTLVLQCPGCSKIFPPSSPESLWNMLSHMRSQHMRFSAKLLASISDELDILIPFMQKKISVWTKRKGNTL